MVINSLCFLWLNVEKSGWPAYYDEFMPLCLLYGRQGKFSLHANKMWLSFHRKSDVWSPLCQVIKIILHVPQKLDTFQMCTTTIMRGGVGTIKMELLDSLRKPILLFCLDSFNLCFCVLWWTKVVKSWWKVEKNYDFNTFWHQKA